MKTVAIDLLWVRENKVGGTEFFVRKLLEGFSGLDNDFHFVLLASNDNHKSFEKYTADKRFELLVADVNSEQISKRILWQIMHQNRFLRKHGITCCLAPVYCRPFTNGGIRYLSSIADLQAYYYPQYHPYYEVLFTKMCWLVDKYKSEHVVAISKYVKEDLQREYHFKEDKVSAIYVPVEPLEYKEEVWTEAKEKYEICDGEYYYTVGQMIPHKNMITLLKVMDKMRNEDKLPHKLLISGINGNMTSEINKKIEELNIGDNVVLTGFVSNEMKAALMKHCRTFLFPSVFEGFGIPPIEAMMCGAHVITTKCTCIPEVTQEKAEYVDDPYGVDDWIEHLRKDDRSQHEIDITRFDAKNIAKQYFVLMEKVFS